MTEHTWAHECLDAYVTGTLSGEERERVERHLAECAECSAAVADIRAMEGLLQGACVRVRPDVGLEDRAIQRLRTAPRRRPQWLRFSLAAAAVILFGLIGLTVQALALDGVLPMPGMDRQTARVRERRFMLFGYDPDFVGGTFVNKAAGIRLAHEDEVAAQQQSALKRANIGGVADANAPKFFGRSKEGENDHLDIKKAFDDIKGSGALDRLEKQGVLLGSQRIINPADFAARDKQQQEANETFYKHREGLDKDIKDREKTLKLPDPAEKGRDKTTLDGMAALTKGDRSAPFGGGGSGGGGSASNGKSANGLLGLNKDALVMPPGGGMMGVTMTGGMGMVGGSGMGMMGGMGTTPATGYYNMNTPMVASGPTPRTGTTYLPTLPPPVTPAPSQPVTIPAPGPNSPGQGGALNVGEKKPETPAIQKPAQQPPTPEKMGRMIIRTGDMDFETDSFDNAVQIIAKLITGTQGSFIATINSDKLPNGKTKGSVVVRMPPSVLDKFIFDLRRDLGKSSELKNQRLGSLDITKAYTDIESRLRAARAIEDRLINIIKTGKGEIKDLVAAEKELGIWRTKIEEMEGEIRYYANQVSLSTLTITLYEKEIQAPTAIVVTETVTIRIEADEVGKAHQAAMKAVEDVKGRITRSDLKQHTAGQFISTLSADVPPAKKEAFIEQLRKLGIVSDFQENQRQTMEGGTGKAPELKPRTSDVHFEITIHNTANIRPRLSADLKVASTDVPGAYTKLLDLVAKVKGQVRDGKLNEQDKLNIQATLDFNVPTAEKPAIDKLLESIGPTLESVNIRAPISEVSTPSKYGYTLLLRDFASIPPKLGLVEIIAVNDVVLNYAKLQDVIGKAKGQVADAKLDEQNKFAVTAQLEFTIPSDQKADFEKLLGDLGTMLSRSNVRAQPNVLATAKKFGFYIVLRDIANIQPTHASDLKIAVSDVPGSYAKLVKAVTDAQGKIRTAELKEQEKPKTSALLAFTITVADKSTLDKLLGELGVVLSRDNTQAPASELTTGSKFGYAVVLRDVGIIAPREVISVKQEVKDVPARIAEISEIVTAAKGRVVDPPNTDRDEQSGQTVGIVKLEVPFASRNTLLKQIEGSNKFRGQKMVPNPQVPENEYTTAQIVVTLIDKPFVSDDQSLGSYVQSSLSMSLRMFSVCVMLIILGVSAVLPWVLLVWLAYKVYAKLAWSSGTPSVSEPPPPGPAPAT